MPTKTVIIDYCLEGEAVFSFYGKICRDLCRGVPFRRGHMVLGLVQRMWKGAEVDRSGGHGDGANIL